MTESLLKEAILTAAFLLALGLTGVLVRRNILFMLFSIEIMLNAAALAFVAAGAKWGSADGQVVYLLILTVAAAEVAVGLALVLQIRAKFRTVSIDDLKGLKG